MLSEVFKIIVSKLEQLGEPDWEYSVAKLKRVIQIKLWVQRGELLYRRDYYLSLTELGRPTTEAFVRNRVGEVVHRFKRDLTTEHGDTQPPT